MLWTQGQSSASIASIASIAGACSKWLLRAAMPAAVLATLMLATPSRAQTPDNKKRAGELFNEGVQQFDAEQYEKALRAFEQAYRLAPHYMVRVNMAGCFAKLHRPVEALFNYERFLEESEGKVPPEQESEVRDAIAKLEKQVGTVEFDVQPANASVRIDGRAPRTLPDGRIVMAAGDYPVEVYAHGYERHKETLTLRGAETSTLYVRLAPTPAIVTSPEQPALQEEFDPFADEMRPASDERAWWMRSRTHWAFLGTGLALGAGAVIAGGMTLKANHDFDGAVARVNDPAANELQRAQARNDGLAFADRSDAAGLSTDILMSGAIAMGAGAFIMWLVTRSRDKHAGATAHAAPILTRSSAGLSLQGAF